MVKKARTIGRFDAPAYVTPIREMFEENFPDNVPMDFIIDHTIKYFWKYIDEQLKQDKVVDVYGYGKFSNDYKVAPTTGNLQYYPKFKFSKNYTVNLRDFKGTTTDAEKAEMERKKEYANNLWAQRKDYLLRTRGKIPEKLQKYDNPNSINITPMN